MNNNFGKWADANNQSDCIHMEVDSSGRYHFPGGGIPSSLRGARLGYKLYRGLLEQKKWLKSKEVRNMLGISPGTLQTLRINGTIPYSKVGGVIYYDNDEIQRILYANKINNGYQS